ncbi:MAG: hypothetical protein JRF63_01390 [Deltaproteobacteria bacterium]|nr:hypothetical protein [Deltaproteobacteria bacterium]
MAPAACFTSGAGDPVSGGECRCPDSILTLDEAGSSAVTPRAGGTIAIRIPSEPGTLLSMLTTDPVVAQIADHDLLEALVAADPATGEPSPELAESWTEDEATGRYIFYLDQAATWHDGARVTSADVEFTFERLLDPAGGAVMRKAFLDVDTVIALDDHTVQITLDRGRHDFVASLTALPILPAHAFGNDLIAGHPVARAPIGSGPFRFSIWRRGRAIELERNPTWRGEAPKVERLIYHVVPDQRVAVDLFRGGVLDIVPDSESGEMPRVEGGRVIAYPLPRFEAWVYNLREPIFSDQRVRKAIGQLIDRAAIRCSILDCLAEPIEHPFPADQGQTISLEPQEFDPASARMLLEQAGWTDSDGDGVRDRNGDRLSFTVLLPDAGRAQRRSATMVQHDMARSGVEMRLRSISWSEYTGRLRDHRFEVSVITFPNAPPFDPRPIFHSTAAADGRNFGSFVDPRTDEILDGLAAAHTKAARQELAAGLAARLREVYPVTFTFRPYRSVLLRDSIRGVRIRGAWIDERSLWLAEPSGGAK